MTDEAPDAQPKPAPKEPRKKTEAEKQEQKDAMINLWIGNMDQDKKEDPKAKALAALEALFKK